MVVRCQPCSSTISAAIVTPTQAGYYHIAEQLGQGGFGFAGDEIRADWANLGDVEVLSFSRLGGVTHADRLGSPRATPRGVHRPELESAKVLAKGHRATWWTTWREALSEPASGIWTVR